MRLLACVSVAVCVSLLLLGRSEAEAKECKEGYLQCGDIDECVNNTWICDGTPFCSNDFDELNCTSCQEGSFLCDGSHCVDDRHRCDGVAWCKDGTDEAKCDSIKSVPACSATTRCNGKTDTDCWIGDDEVYCTPDMCQAPATKEAYSGGRCRDPNARCNGVKNFKDENDEDNCTECHGGSVLCGTSCFSLEDVCDGQVDCKDGSDELNCTSCKGNSFHCDGSRCVDNSHKCDGVAWCRDGTDEANCTRIKSEPECSASTRCNGVRTGCWSKDDELLCTPDMCQAPASSSTYCDGRCLKASSWCDGRPDCSDGQDEARCPGR